ncbi:unnamed protein product, partial [Rotaria sordida]
MVHGENETFDDTGSMTSEPDWDTIDQAQVINDVRLAFESSDVELTTDDDDSLY